MVKIEFYYKSADKDKTEAMREAIDIALFGTNVQCNFKNLPDHLILEDMILEKAVAGKNITEYPTCIIIIINFNYNSSRKFINFFS
jgi:hypothetical protein